MKINSPILASLAAAAVCLASAGSLHALPIINVPETGSTGLLAGVAICGLLFVGRMLKR